MKERKTVPVDAAFYQIGKIIWLPVLLIGSWFVKTGYTVYGDYLDCSLYRMTHFPCPGCGGTRAVYYLFTGDIFKSVCFHPAVFYGVIAYLHFMILYFVRKHIRKNTEQKEIHIEYYLYLFAGVVVLQWIVKMVAILV